MSKLSKANQDEEFTFWEHLEVLRWAIFRSLAVILTLMFIGFGFKDFIFNQIILPPLSSEFLTYKLLCSLSQAIELPSLCFDDFQIEMINVNLTGQFLVHMTTSLAIGFLFAFPYLLYEFWRFIKPALYANEKSSVGKVFLLSSLLFYCGIGISYYIVFPFSIRFLGTYQVSNLVVNQISITSYMNTLVLLLLFLGIAFELPVIIYLLSKIGLIKKSMLRPFRKYALLIIVIVAAVVTPTSDPFTLAIVSIPLYLLYELSILFCKEDVPPDSIR